MGLLGALAWRAARRSCSRSMVRCARRACCGHTQVMTDHQLIDFLWFAAYGVVAVVACAVLVIGVIARNYRWRLRRALER
jgi:hypothetical protein